MEFYDQMILIGFKNGTATIFRFKNNELILAKQYTQISSNSIISLCSVEANGQNTLMVIDDDNSILLVKERSNGIKEHSSGDCLGVLDKASTPYVFPFWTSEASFIIVTGSISGFIYQATKSAVIKIAVLEGPLSEQSLFQQTISYSFHYYDLHDSPNKATFGILWEGKSLSLYKLRLICEGEAEIDEIFYHQFEKLVIYFSAYIGNWVILVIDESSRFCLIDTKKIMEYEKIRVQKREMRPTRIRITRSLSIESIDSTKYERSSEIKQNESIENSFIKIVSPGFEQDSMLFEEGNISQFNELCCRVENGLCLLTIVGPVILSLADVSTFLFKLISNEKILEVCKLMLSIIDDDFRALRNIPMTYRERKALLIPFAKSIAPKLLEICQKDDFTACGKAVMKEFIILLLKLELTDFLKIDFRKILQGTQFFTIYAESFVFLFESGLIFKVEEDSVEEILQNIKLRTDYLKHFCYALYQRNQCRRQVENILLETEEYLLALYLANKFNTELSIRILNKLLSDIKLSDPAEVRIKLEKFFWTLRISILDNPESTMMLLGWIRNQDAIFFLINNYPREVCWGVFFILLTSDLEFMKKANFESKQKETSKRYSNDSNPFFMNIVERSVNQMELSKQTGATIEICYIEYINSPLLRAKPEFLKKIVIDIIRDSSLIIDTNNHKSNDHLQILIFGLVLKNKELFVDDVEFKEELRKSE